jgi:hypothetical protein
MDPCGLPEGETCFDGDAQHECRPGLYCDVGATNTCVAPPGEGELCPQETCAGDLFCSSGTCTRRLANGQPCNSGSQCESRLCNDGTCLSAPGEGESCATACAPDLFCVEGTCRAAAGAGQPCANVGCQEPLICGSSGVCETLPPAVCN